MCVLDRDGADQLAARASTALALARALKTLLIVSSAAIAGALETILLAPIAGCRGTSSPRMMWRRLAGRRCEPLEPSPPSPA
jgi:hypothetical protein